MPAFRRKDASGVTYFSTKPPRPPFEFTAAQRKQLGPDTMERMLAQLPANVEEQEATTLADLAAMTPVAKYLGQLFQQTKEAREELAVTLLGAGEDLDAVQQACGVSWATLHAWCHEKRGASRTKKLRVPEAVVEELSLKEQEAALERSGVVGKREARGGQGGQRGREFRHLEERIRQAEDEYRQTAGEAPYPGCSQELDELYGLRDNWFH